MFAPEMPRTSFAEPGTIHMLHVQEGLTSASSQTYSIVISERDSTASC